MSGMDTVRKMQRIIMIVMLPFLVLWLVAMTVVFAIKMPVVLLFYPLAGLGVWFYRAIMKARTEKTTEQTATGTSKRRS